MTILAGDIGGTKTLIRAVDAGAPLVAVAEKRYASAHYDEFSDLIVDFLAEYGELLGSIDRACFGVAGPVENTPTGQRARITNLPWTIDTQLLSQHFGFQQVRLINDFEAIGYGLELLQPNELVTLQQGSVDESGNRVIIGAGTGLGVALMVKCGDDYRVLPTEGGHADFAPRGELQIEFARFLSQNYGRAAVEFALSGPGLVNIFRFLHQYHQGDEGELASIMNQTDPAAAIASSADNGDPLANEALAIFIDIYGGTAGNVALTSMARGGVYVAGGIAAKLLDRLGQGAFVQAFNDKGKMQPLVELMPVQVVLNPEVGLLGSVNVAINL